MTKPLIYFTGFRACGKTSVARLVGQAMEVAVIDLDAEIVQHTGQSVAEIFRDQGETGFRDLESAQMQRVARLDRGVVSLGGGTVLRQENCELISQSGRCIWLDAETDLVISRLAGDAQTADQRPSLTGDSIQQEVRQLMEARRPIYERVADFRIDTTRYSVQAVAEMAIEWLKTSNSSSVAVSPS